MDRVFGRLTGKSQQSKGSHSHALGNGVDANSLDVHANSTSALPESVPGAEVQESSTRNLQQQPQPHRRDSSILSLSTANLTDLSANVKRSVSLRSHRTTPSSSSSFAQKTRSPGGGNNFTPLSSASPIESGDEGPNLDSPSKEKAKDPEATTGASTKETALLRRKISLTARGLSHKFRSTEALPQLNNPGFLDGGRVKSPPLPTSDPASMLVGTAPGSVPGSRKGAAAHPDSNGARPGLGVHSQSSFTRDISSSHGGPNGAPLSHAPSAPSAIGGPMNPNNIYVQIQETSAKRMATMEYLRKLHDGDIFYFSTIHCSQGTLSNMPSLYPHKLGRRATNYFILGLSLPAVLDLNASNPLEYLKALSSLLQEFETYQTLSGYDSSGNSLSRGRMGAMFKSGMGFGGRGAKGRRSSTATDMSGASLGPGQADYLGGRSPSDGGSPNDMSSPVNPSGHEFSFLLTPHITFEPDFGATFGTLCDALIDTYAKLTVLVPGPDACTPSVGNEFSKADKAIRKILVSNVVREFEDTTRAVTKGEMAGLGKLVLGGLM